MPGSLTNLLFHVVFSTKHRLPLISQPLREPLYAFVAQVLRSKGGSVLEVGGVANHIHLLVRLGSTLSIAEAVRLLKSNSSRWLNDPARLDGGFRWQAGYGAFTVSASLGEKVRQYIRNQEQHHAHRTFEDEMRTFAERHGVEDVG